jgi:selenocysteine lyase/cysteine desulfurase
MQLYFDNAATSYPKPDVVLDAIVQYNTTVVPAQAEVPIRKRLKQQIYLTLAENNFAK